MNPDIQRTRLKKRRDDAIEDQVNLSNSIENVRGTNISGYRSMHLTQIYRYGIGTSKEYRVGDQGTTPVVGA